MAIDDVFEVAREIFVERRGRPMRFGQSDGFREQAARMRLRGAQYSDGPLAIFDDDFCAGAHVGQERRHIGSGSFRLRNPNHILSHVVIIHLAVPWLLLMRQWLALC